MSANQRGVAMPEWLARRDRENGSWTVKNGPAERGQAWTNQRERVMRVPFGGDETNRVIRAHEMAHARVSPELAILGTELGISEGAVRSAEEFRVNQLVRAAGFDTNLLVDGSEKTSGERLAEMVDYAGLVHSIAAMAGTDGAKAFLRGVKSINPDLAKAIREVEKAVLKTWNKTARKRGDKWTAKCWGDTQPVGENGYTVGYKGYVIPLAKMLDMAVSALEIEGDGSSDAEDEDDVKPDLDLLKDAVNGRTGRWGKLMLDTSVRPTRNVRGTLGKRRSATNMGRHPRRMNRMLTDPQRRVFDKTTRGIGGIVIIDQSGSMRLSVEDIESIMEASPGCTIIGYSHRAGSVDVPNIWILAEGGKRVEQVRRGHGGNGVDVPAVKFALSKARRGESVIWVCDGIVTCGDEDNTYRNLDDEAARLVKRNGIHMVRNVEGAIESLTCLARGERLPTKFIGPVYSAASRLELL
jgi:hypothetical protein